MVIFVKKINQNTKQIVNVKGLTNPNEYRTH